MRRSENVPKTGHMPRTDWHLVACKRLTGHANPLMMNRLASCARRPMLAVAGTAARLPHSRLLPPRSMVGQLPLEQHIGVRIPGGQPIIHFKWFGEDRYSL